MSRSFRPRHLLQQHPISCFLVMTFLVSLVAGTVAFALGGEQTFDDPRLLPLLLLTIWSPNLAAVVVSWRRGNLRALLKRLSQRAPLSAWLVATTPLWVAAVLAVSAKTAPDISWQLVAALTAMNFIMGPLGEELGWRGFLFPALNAKLGFVATALVVGLIWGLWHAPLWLLPSPQSAISFVDFMCTVICFSAVMAWLWAEAEGALGPVVLFHLAANLGVGVLEVGNVMPAADAYAQGLPLYAALAVLALCALAWRARNNCRTIVTGM